MSGCPYVILMANSLLDLGSYRVILEQTMLEGNVASGPAELDTKSQTPDTFGNTRWLLNLHKCSIISTRSHGFGTPNK